MTESDRVHTVNDPLHRNWLKCVLALNLLKCGLEDFVNTYTKLYHDKLKKDARKIIISGNLEQCSQCFVNQIKPWHVHANSCCPHQPPTGRSKCPCAPKMRGKLLCTSPGSPCSVILDLIADGHYSGKPIFCSTDCTRWVSDHWSIALCYLSTQGYSRSSCASDLDAAGLLSVVINCKFLRDYIEDKTPLERVRKSRNTILHSATYQLSDTEMHNIIQDIVCILKDKRYLVNDPNAQQAVQQLMKLKNDEGAITLDDAKELKQIAIDAIEKTKENAIETLTEHTDIQLQKLQQKHDEFLQKTKINTTVAQEVLDDLQQYLVDTYRKYYVKVDVTPLLPEEDDDIEFLYVPLRMEKIDRTEKTHQKNLGHDLHQKMKRTNEPVQIDSFEEMLTSGGICKKNIFVIAEAGMGKTTLCRKLTSSWCRSHENRLSKRGLVEGHFTESERSKIIESKLIRQASVKDMLYMQRFSFMFYVSLRHAEEDRSIEEMIAAQLLEESHIQTFKWIIKTMPERCLYIIDGLDEWKTQTKEATSLKTLSGIPKKDNRCTAVFTSRPWKMTELLPRPSDIDIEIRLKGMTSKTIKVLSCNVLDRLNKGKGKSLKVDDFQNEIKQRKLQGLLAVPLMLKLLLCSWFNNHKLHDTKTGVYVDVVQLMLKIFRDQKEHQCITRQISEPSGNDLDKLPQVLRQKDEYIQFARMIIGLADFSYNSFIQSDSLVFESSCLTHCGMKNVDIELCLKAGFLSKTTIKTQSVVSRKIQLSYVHRTFQEFFAAIYLSIHPDMLTFVLHKCTNRHSLGKLARILQFTSGFSSEAVLTISEYIFSRSEIKKDDGTCRLVQDTISGCLSDAKLKPEVKSLSLKVLQLGVESDLNLIPFIRPNTVRRLDVSHHVTCQEYTLRCIMLMTGLTQLLIMNRSDDIDAYALLSFVQRCQNLKELELDEYDLTTLREQSLHLCMGNVTYIRLFGCTLTHTQVTNLLCEAPSLTDITLWSVKCVSDTLCGCDYKDDGETQMGEQYIETSHETERRCLHGTVSVTKCHVYDSSQVLCHVLQSENLTTLLIDEYEFSEDRGLELFISRCTKLQNLELDNIPMDYRNLIGVITNAKPGVELKVTLNNIEVLGEDANQFKNLLDTLPFVNVPSFCANDHVVTRASIIVSKPREKYDEEFDNAGQSSDDDDDDDDDERPLLDRRVEDVSNSDDVHFEIMSMSEERNMNLWCCKCSVQ